MEMSDRCQKFKMGGASSGGEQEYEIWSALSITTQEPREPRNDRGGSSIGTDKVSATSASNVAAELGDACRAASSDKSDMRMADIFHALSLVASSAGCSSPITQY